MFFFSWGWLQTANYIRGGLHLTKVSTYYSVVSHHRQAEWHRPPLPKMTRQLNILFFSYDHEPRAVFPFSPNIRVCGLLPGILKIKY